MLYLIYASIVIAILAIGWVALGRLSRRNSSFILLYAVTPVLAAGAAQGHWTAVAGLVIVLAAIPIHRYANSMWPV